MARVTCPGNFGQTVPRQAALRQGGKDAQVEVYEEQMVSILREADQDRTATVSKRHGVSEQTIYTWRKCFGGFQADDVRRLKQLEAENLRLAQLDT